MNIIIAWTAICLACAGLGVIGGLWLAARRRAREAPDKAAVEAAHAYVKTLFDVQSQAIAGAHRTSRDEQAKALERQAALQVRRDEVLAAQLAELMVAQQRGFASMEAATTVQLGNFLKALATLRAKEAPAESEAPVKTTTEVAKEATVEKPPSASPARAATPTPTPTPTPQALPLARPPELLLTPIRPPAPMAGPEPVARELSDAELDAMPPDLPPATPRKRLLPAPKSPAMGRL